MELIEKSDQLLKESFAKRIPEINSADAVERKPYLLCQNEFRIFLPIALVFWMQSTDASRLLRSRVYKFASKSGKET